MFYLVALICLTKLISLNHCTNSLQFRNFGYKRHQRPNCLPIYLSHNKWSACTSVPVLYQEPHEASGIFHLLTKNRLNIDRKILPLNMFKVPGNTFIWSSKIRPYRYHSWNPTPSATEPRKNNSLGIQSQTVTYWKSSKELGSSSEVRSADLNSVGIQTTELYDFISKPLVPEESSQQRKENLFNRFSHILDYLDHTFYTATFNTLRDLSPPDGKENAISFVQSGLFLALYLMALSTEADQETKAEIYEYVVSDITDREKISLINEILTSLPKSDVNLKWSWTSRLVLGASQNVSRYFREGAAAAFHLHLDHFNGTETPEELAQTLNKMVQEDSGGVIRNTFDADEFAEGVGSVALTTLYLRARWRSAPTLLNGTRPFLEHPLGNERSTRMIRINDIMRYGYFHDRNFQAIEIMYATPGLTLLILLPDGRSLRSVYDELGSTGLRDVTKRMVPMRVAATMPLYTLRMTLLLPSKLKSMGVNKLVDWTNEADSGKIRLSHAVQRIMFWSEAGRNAFKDDGIEWDAPPEMEIVVDHPYLFFVRWHNITLMNGNFAL